MLTRCINELGAKRVIKSRPPCFYRAPKAQLAVTPLIGLTAPASDAKAVPSDAAPDQDNTAGSKHPITAGF